MVDTANIPVNYRLISFEYEGIRGKILGTIYTIEVKCSELNGWKFKPSFLRKMKEGGQLLTVEEFKKMNLITLPQFIDLISSEKNIYDFAKKYNVYVIEPHSPGYILYSVQTSRVTSVY